MSLKIYLSKEEMLKDVIKEQEEEIKKLKNQLEELRQWLSIDCDICTTCNADCQKCPFYKLERLDETTNP